MSLKVVSTLIAATAMVVAATSWSAAADMSLRTSRSYSSHSSAIGTRTTLGFWGEAFPYGYRWSLVRACERRLEVETPHGVRWRTVWVCRVPRYAALR